MHVASYAIAARGVLDYSVRVRSQKTSLTISSQMARRLPVLAAALCVDPAALCRRHRIDGSAAQKQDSP